MWFERVAVVGVCLFILLASSRAMAEDAPLMKVAQLRCEYRQNPLGIDAQQPRLSWVIDVERRGAAQTAYEIVVSSSESLLTEGKGDLWSTGKVASADTIQIPYVGKALASRMRCYWKVRVWDDQDRPGPWSESACWEMGLLAKEDWQGAYIGLDAAHGNPDCPFLRKTFELDDLPSHARAYVNALGYYELYVNGRKVDDLVLAPGVSQYSKRSFYLAHDVAPYLKKGKNSVALWLGGGWYAEGLPGVVHKGPLVRAQLEMTGASGGTQRIATGTDWKACASPLVGTGTWRPHRFGGERYDAQQETDGWGEPDFDDSAWVTASAVDVPDHTVCAQPAQVNRIQRRYEPLDIRFLGKGAWLVDFGTNLTGWFEVTFRDLQPGQKVVLDYFDRVAGHNFDNLGQQDTYIAKGGAEERFRNRFNYHAFRYVKLSGIDAAPAADDLRAYLIHTDYDLNSSFACSDPMMNRIHDMVFYTLRCLSLGGYLVDCPHIERLGYGGDGQASTPTALTMFGMGPLYTGWLGHWRDCQRPDGDMPHTAPNPYKAGGGPYWCGFIIAASWELYTQYGDVRVLEDNYPAMQLWLDGYAEAHCQDDLLGEWPNTDYRNWYLGDWARPKRNEAEAKRSVTLVNNCFRIQCFDWMAGIAHELGREDDAKRYRAKAEDLRPIVHAAFYDADRQTYADDTQLDLSYPLLAGVTPEELRPAILKRLEDKIVVEFEGHLDVGLVGVPIMTQQLLEAGRSDLVYAYASKDSFPGWGYMLRNGATTTWEHWDASRSHIHNCYNGIGVWFYRALAGVRPDSDGPGFEHFELRPEIVGGITWVAARQMTMRGAVESAWRIADGRFDWDVLVPANTTATIAVPAANPDAVTESGKPVAQANGVRFVKSEPGRAIYEVQSGRYAFSAPR